MAKEQKPLAHEADSRTVDLTPGDSDAGQRLDHFLMHHLPWLSRSRLSQAIKDGHILVNGSEAKASRKLQQDDLIRGAVPGIRPPELVPQPVAFDILYEDASLLLLSKPPGLVVHPADGNPDMTLVNGLLHHCRSFGQVGDSLRPGIVHRLDKDTSGIMVVAKQDEIHRRLSELFKRREVRKKYHALVCGVMQQDQGRIAAPIGRHPVNRKKMAVREQDGRFAATSWKVLQTYGGRYSLLELEIETGRTHQIRVHMASIGHSVAGDALYGGTKDGPLFPRQMLHASELILTHPVSGARLAGTATLWPDMQEALARLDQERS